MDTTQDTAAPDAPHAPNAPVSPAETYLTAEQILGADDRTYRVVHCPEWGGKVRLRNFSGDERALYEYRLAKRKAAKPDAGRNGAAKVSRLAVVEEEAEGTGYIGLREEALFLCAVDAQGRATFTDRRQVERLRRKNAAPLDRCFNAILDMAGMTERERDRINAELDADPSAGGSSE